jgi:hypothetical protein
MSDSKILLTYKDDNNNYQIETVWATKEGLYYRINNIPFFASNITLNDIVDVEEENGVLYFEKLVEASGHTTIQMVIFKKEDLSAIEEKLELLGCTWERSHLDNLISIDVPKNLSYRIVKSYLDEGEIKGLWSYKEACFSHIL